ncbi:ZIP Zinc transporter family protein [Tritrichomonas foetus]|uniref:ZIP Zinc transporter family protein n=1 Tax=Tritrichomonas foetus TaxID=1144522 RepID=A0A1J4JTP9_9EUKA|nr:ZIP Zinc transporter family protein [Tritrichomonas foetus]|eukprot:OHT00886.1 ZIP Zinc transporter family protein [Tritrichomonas foetus]
MEKVELFKWISAPIIWISTLIGCILPLFIKAKKWTARLESLAGGVFLGAGLAHLLADSFEEFEDVDGLDYPLAPAIALATFVLLTLVELFSYSEHDANVFGDDHHHHHHGHSHDHANEPLINSGNKNEATLNTTSLLSTEDQNNEIINPANRFGDSIKNLTTATISLYLIMDIHSAIEGLALGILDSWSGVIAIFCAIIGHKPVEAFALALILLKDRPLKSLFWVMIFFYTIMSPVGICVGIRLTEMSGHLALGIIAAFSAGTFLFVGCHEWSEMFEHKHEWSTCEKFWHFGLFAFGILWMLLIAIIEGLGEAEE